MLQNELFQAEIAAHPELAGIVVPPQRRPVATGTARPPPSRPRQGSDGRRAAETAAAMRKKVSDLGDSAKSKLRSIQAKWRQRQAGGGFGQSRYSSLPLDDDEDGQELEAFGEVSGAAESGASHRRALLDEHDKDPYFSPSQPPPSRSGGRHKKSD